MKPRLDLYVGPPILKPLWLLYMWWVDRWITHDCARHPILCRLPADLWLGWTERWTEGPYGDWRDNPGNYGE